MTHDTQLLIDVVAALALLVVLVSGLRLHAFLALLLAAVFLGLLSGMSAGPLLGALQKGVGDVLGFVAMVLGLGAMLGRLLTASGGADRIALTLVDRFGPRRESSIRRICCRSCRNPHQERARNLISVGTIRGTI